MFLEPVLVPVGVTEPVIFAVVLSSESVGLSDSRAVVVLLAEDSSVEGAAPLDAREAAVDRGAAVVVGSAESELS